MDRRAWLGGKTQRRCQRSLICSVSLLPLPALALSSLSSEDEIVWIKPGSRPSPPMLPVLRMPPVWRDEPSAIAQPLNDASPSPVVLLTLWRQEVRHLGSTVTLLLGALAFFGAASRIGNGDPLVAGVLTAGLVLILGALVYRSAKRRRLGEVASTPARWVLEGIAIVLMFLIVVVACCWPFRTFPVRRLHPGPRRSRALR